MNTSELIHAGWLQERRAFGGRSTAMEISGISPETLYLQECEPVVWDDCAVLLHLQGFPVDRS